MKTKFLIVGGGLSGLIMGMELTKRGEEYIIIEKNGKPIEAKLHYLHADLSGYFPFKLREIDIVTNWLDKDNKVRSDAPTAVDMNNFSYVTTNTIFQNSMKFLMTAKLGKGWIPEGGIRNISEMVRQFNKNQPLIGYELKSIDHTNKIANVIHINKIKDPEQGGDIETPENITIEYEKIISTIPLPFMLNIAGIDTAIEFKTEPLKMTEVKFDKKYYEDLFQIFYLSYATFGYSRLSILGDRIVAEKANGEFEATEGENRLGLKKLIAMVLPNCNPSKAQFEDQTNWYGRYIPIEESKRAELMRALEKKDVVCLGRYAEWTYRRTDHVVKIAEQIAEANSVKKG